jgi:hypothetical protein
VTTRRTGINARRMLLGCSTSLLLLLILYGDAIFSFASPPQSSKPTDDYALIYGTVWGPDGRRVAGVPVKIRRSSDKKAKWELVSDNSGEFAQRVPVGTQDYVVQADIKVPKGTPKPEATIHIDDNERKDVGLHLTEQQLPRK